MDKDKEDQLRQTSEEILRDAMPTPLAEGGGIMREIYLTLRRSGFTRMEALWIVGYCISAGSTNIGDEDDGSYNT